MWEGNFALDIHLYKITIFAFAILSVPIAFFIVYVLSGKNGLSVAISSLFLIFGILYANNVYSNGIEGPILTKWGSIYAIGSESSIYIYIFGLFVLPTALILGILVLVLLRKIPKKKRFHITFSLLSISFVLDFILVDLISVNPAMQAFSRMFILIGTTLGYLAHFTPALLENRLGIHSDDIDEGEFDEIISEEVSEDGWN